MKKNIFNIIIFSLVISSFMFFWIFKEKEEVIASERRKATKMPPISQIFDDTYSQEFDKHMSDTFPLREAFRKINTALRLDILRQSDVNGYYRNDGHISKVENEFRENQIIAGANKINEITEKYLQNSNVFYSVIPDKNYFLAKKSGYPHIDYEKMLTILSENIARAEYIDIFPLLSIDDYYKTDSHWRQEKILPVAEKLLQGMGKPLKKINYTENTVNNFIGVHGQQSGIKSSPEGMTYLTNDTLLGIKVTSVEDKGTLDVYNKEKLDSPDMYDTYLHGAKALLTLERESDSPNHLIIFRDSFGSSIAPLFAENYSKITLVDLRYISSSVIGDYVDFQNADVLFLYNTSIVNNAMLLR